MAAAGNAGGDSYWYRVYELSQSENFYFRDVATDSSGNVYAAGIEFVAIDGNCLVKLSADGDHEFAKQNTSRPDCYAVTVLSDDTPVFFPSQAGGDSMFYLALNPDTGARDTEIKYSGNGTTEIFDAARDSNDNVLIAGKFRSTNTGDSAPSVISIDSSDGSINWGRGFHYNNLSSGERSRGVVVDSSDNVYAVASISGGDVNAIKYNSSGVVQWEMRQNTAVGLIESCVVDSSNNLYFSGQEGGSDAGLLLGKIASDGSALTYIYKYATNNKVEGQKLAIDSSDNIYLVGFQEFNNSSSTRRGVITSVDTSGNINWQRFFYPSGETSYNCQILGVTVDPNDNLIICGRWGVTLGANAFIAKLPSDGSLTGNYGTGDYSLTYTSTGTSLTRQNATDYGGFTSSILNYTVGSYTVASTTDSHSNAPIGTGVFTQIEE
jgi:hypothetical protein